MADVVIIGAGYTGLNAALTLAREAGMSALVLDAAPIGWGASGRNGGFCCLGSSKLSWSAIVRRFGLEQAQAFFRLQVDAIEHVRNLLISGGIDAEAGPDGEAIIAHHPRAVPGLHDDAELYSDLFGITCEVVPREGLRERGLLTGEAYGALIEPLGFPLHPLKYHLGLARLAIAAGARVHANTPVTGWTREGRRHRLTTPHGTILTAKVVVATAGFTRDTLHPDFDGRLLPVLTNIVTTRPLTAQERAEQGFDSQTMCADTRHLLHYFRLLPDNRLMFGARGGILATPQAQADMREQLIGDLGRMFPAWKGVEITHFWRGLTDLSFDLLPHLGTNEDGTIHYLLAFHGNGVAMGSYGGSLIGRRLAGHAVDLPTPLTRPMPAFPFPDMRQRYLQLAYAGLGLKDRFGL